MGKNRGGRGTGKGGQGRAKEDEKLSGELEEKNLA